MHSFDTMNDKRQVILRESATFTEYGEQLLILSNKRIDVNIRRGKPTEPQYKVIIPIMFATLKAQQAELDELRQLSLGMAELSKQMATMLSELKHKTLG